MRVRLSVVVSLVCALGILGAAQAASAALPPIHHVFIIVLENESASTSFGPASPAPYLSQTLPSQGAFVPNYYGIGHSSLDNYIAMIGGQPPNPTTQADCPTFRDVVNPGAANENGCVYPAGVPTIASQLTGAGLTWRGYMEDMGNTLARDGSATCSHPTIGAPDGTESATASDQYATRHDPFVYYHSIIDTSQCNTNVVPLTGLTQDLSSIATTANYTFITPNLCNDGHDTNCANGDPGGLPQADGFLRTWVPQITSSPAYRQDGLLLVMFDEGVADSSACCNEQPGPAAPSPGGNQPGGGAGGGRVGAVMLSPFITPGTVSQTAYNHYSMLGSIEDLFGLPHLGDAQLPGQSFFANDIYTNYTPPMVPPPIVAPPAPVAALTAPALASSASARPQVTLRYSAALSGAGTVASYTVQSRDLGVRRAAWRTLAAGTSQTSLTVSVTAGHTYSFRVAATDASGQTGAFASSTTVVPSGVRPANGHYGGRWATVKRTGAWLGHAIQSSTPGATFTLRYVGARLTLVGETSRAGGRLRVTLDGRSRTVRLHSSRLRVRQALVSIPASLRTHHLKLTVLSGAVAIEGYGIASRAG